MSYKKFENTFQFLGGYFHQDFLFEFGEPELAIKKYIEDTDEGTRTAVVRELKQIIEEVTEQNLKGFILEELGCYYNPQGIAVHDWLEWVVKEIEQSLILTR